jgi:hypothetical protein
MHLDNNIVNKIKDFLSKYSLYEFVRELFCRQENWPELKKIGHFNVIKWLNSNVKEKWDTEVYELLVRENALAHLIFLKDNGHQIDVSLASFTEACKQGQLQMVEFLDGRAYKDSFAPMEAAAQNRHSKIVKFLYKCGYKCSSLVMEWAAYNNDFHLVEYLNDNNDDNVLVTKRTISFILEYIGI